MTSLWSAIWSISIALLYKSGRQRFRKKLSHRQEVKWKCAIWGLQLTECSKIIGIRFETIYLSFIRYTVKNFRKLLKI